MPMTHRTPSDTFVRVANQFKQDMETAFAYMEENDVYGRLHNQGIKVDTRDFIPMVALMGIEGDTQEDRTRDIHQKLEHLATVFSDSDHTKRYPYLDMIYDLLDAFAGEFDPTEMDMENPEHVSKLLKSMLIDQTISKKKEENPEYYQNRYPTPSQRNLADACDHMRMAIGATTRTNLAANGISINIQLSLPNPIPEDLMDIQYCRELYEKNMLEEAKRTNGNLPKSAPIYFPILDDLIPSVGKDLKNIPNLSDEVQQKMFAYVSLLVENSQAQKGTKALEMLKESGIEEAKNAMYIDGQPLNDFIKNNYPDQLITEGLRYNVITTCMLSGKHKVDVVHAYRNEAGEVEYEPKTLRATVTPEQEKAYLMQFSWIRRTLFNWWPFKIETLQEKMDRNLKDPDKDERFSTIVADQKAKIEAALEKKAKAQRDAQLAQEKKNKVQEAYNKENQRLMDSAARWDKNSVIGILGQQMTATHKIQNKEPKGAYESIQIMMAGASGAAARYQNAAPMFAKVVLYSQLCQDRTENSGQPGEIEKALNGPGPEAIRNNIAATANNLARDPAFKKLFMEKTCGGGIPDINIFRRMVASGGCERFRQEYMQSLKDRISQKEQTSSVKENEMTQQMEQKSQKAPLS